MLGARSKTRISGISRIFSLTFINPSFQYSSIMNIENLDFKNPRFPNIHVFDIHLCLKISDFLKSKFSILYRKHRFIKVGEKNLRYPSFRSAHMLAFKDELVNNLIGLEIRRMQTWKAGD